MDLKIMIAEVGEGGYAWSKKEIILKNVKPDVTVHDVEMAVRQIVSKMGDLE